MEPKIDPAHEEAVRQLDIAIAKSEIELPNIGTAKITGQHTRIFETYPPRRVTTLTIEIVHHA